MLLQCYIILHYCTFGKLKKNDGSFTKGNIEGGTTFLNSCFELTIVSEDSTVPWVLIQEFMIVFQI